MDKIKVKIVSAFTKNGKGGNLAGVVIGYDLSEKFKQDLASELGLSETVFITKINDTEYNFQYFTPRSEIGFCGHATVAGLSQLDFNVATIHTKALELKAFNEDKIYFSVGKPSFVNKIIKEEMVLDSLGITKEDLDPRMPMTILRSGIEEIFVPVISKKLLLNINPALETIKKVSEKYNVVGYHLFAIDDEYTAVTRNLAPIVGINEESATGSANSALGFFLTEMNIVKDKDMIFSQGVNMNCESLIYVKVDEEVYLSGNTTLIEELLVEVNEGE